MINRKNKFTIEGEGVRIKKENVPKNIDSSSFIL